MRLLLSLLSVFLLAVPTLADDYAVIVAGSMGYDNYRHQSDVCHAFHVLVNQGMPASNIITMLYDDIANDPSNPYPGQVFNKPTAAGTPGKDVYEGCQKDYVGANVTAAKFLAVITGDAKTAGGRVLTTTTSDRVFLNFVDHGGTGILAFPTGDFLYVADLQKALATMSSKQMFSKLVFYVEACEAGSMFEGVLPANISIYVTTASNAVESSWGTYCPPDDSVNGKSLNSCLGDLYSINWMEDADKVGPQQTLQDQFVIVKNVTTESHVMQYGDISWTSLPTGDFMGGLQFGTHRHSRHASHSVNMDSRDISLHLATYRYIRAQKNTAEHQLAAENLEQLTTQRMTSDKLFQQFAQSFRGSSNAILTGPSKLPVTCDTCCKAVDRAIRDHCNAWNDYSLQYHNIVVNACELHSHSDEGTANLVTAVKSICQA